MKKYTFYFILLLMLVSLLSCNRSPNSDRPVIPADFDIDLNNDGSPDYAILYFDVEVNTKGGRAMIGVMEPYGENEILLSELEPSLFLREVSEIQEEVEAPLLWANTNWLVTIVILEMDEFGKWPAKWKIDSNETFEFYFLGFKLIENNDLKIGWMKLEIDQESGEIQIADFEFL